MHSSSRTIAVIAGVAVLSMAAGLGLGRLIVSPAEAAAQAAAPEPEAITVPVERRALANDVVLRGDVLYEDPASITIEAGDLGGPAVVTGQVPEVGATIEAGQVILEVTGRPVVLLAGELPVYRTLRAGLAGPDVVQLKQALAALGIAAGDPSSDVYDAATAAGVEALYARVGYAPPSAGDEARLAVAAAEESVRAAEEQLAAARAEVAAAGAPLPASERIRLDGAVEGARIRHEQAVAACQRPTLEAPCDQVAVVESRTELDAAVAARDEASAPADTSAARAAVTAAERALAAAREERNRARVDVLTPLPASEVAYLASTPRRVDTVEVSRGSTVAGTPVMTVSGATLQIRGSVTEADAELLSVDLPAVIALPDGSEVPGRVAAIGAEALAGTSSDDGQGAPSAGRTAVLVEPGEITEEQRAMLQGANVRVEVPVSSTDGDVVAVPIAALTAGPGGESRVEVMGDDGETTLVDVETGLAAGGFVEVTPLGGARLDVGDRVVVGQTAGAPPAGAAEDAEDQPADPDDEDDEADDADEESG